MGSRNGSRILILTEGTTQCIIQPRGIQYRTGIYYSDDGDIEICRAALAGIQSKYDKPIAIELAPIVNFYRAEEHHQDYLDKNPGGYCHISKAVFDEVKRMLFVLTAKFDSKCG